MFRPSASLEVEVQQGTTVDDAAPALRRAFSYAGPTRVVASERDATTVRLTVRSTRPYWSGAQDAQEADAAWSDVVRPWLVDKLGKLASVTGGYRRFAQEHGDPDLAFDAIDVALDGAELHIPLTEGAGLPADLAHQLDEARALCTAGLPQGENRITLPLEVRA